MKKLICCGGIALFLAASLTGCSNAIPEMDDSTRARVVEYAAGIVQKYDQNHVHRLQETVLEEAAAEENTKEADQASPKEEAPPEEHTSRDGHTQAGEQENEQPLQPEEAALAIEDVLGLTGIEIQYTDWKTSDFYPEEKEEGELYFSMNATAGNTLLILNFNVQNLSEEEQALDTISSPVRFKIQVNDESKNALTTMLLNDLAHYQGTLLAGENKEMIVVCEISKEQAESISSLMLTVKSDAGTATISLN